MKKIIPFLVALALISCGSDDSSTPTTPEEQMYFPPIGSTTWETKTVESLGWNQSQVQPLLDYLELKNTKSFIVLHNGKIVLENYFNGHSATEPWYWASAGKTLTATVTGIAGAYMFLGPWGNKMKNKAHLIIKDKQLILAAMKGIAKGDAPGELKLKLTKMVTAMPAKG